MYIPISKPYFDDEDKKGILEPLESGWVVQGPKVNAFEGKFANFTKSKFAIATSNCTTALHLGLVALGIQRGDKVIVPSFTYVASANAIEYIGAIPVFCDIDLTTFNIDIQQLIKIIEEQKDIKAIMPINLFGLCADMIKIMEIAKKYNLKIIEDSACGFDSWIGDRHSGTFGDCGCFSFHPRKAITTGEGGMLITDNEEIALKVKMLRDHGAGKSDLQRHNDKNGFLLPNFDVLGYNYRMTDLQGALGNSQMDKAGEIMQERRNIAKQYDSALSGVEQLILPSTPKGYIHSYQSYVCIFGGKESLESCNIHTIDSINEKRNLFMRELENKGIATRQGSHAVHTLGYYKNKYRIVEKDYLQSYKADRLSVSLPLYPQMTEMELEYVIKTIKEIL
ncbi:DegT/DnrJ/EryC1/StrS family aminotransferase [Helicobacter rodentium]|uniref:DegT/DnrJ/EryC1/StrS family aminotransferase n=1 Tax=Helicobacter rodentium TaxID=59617 RepID=UPI0023F01F0C|nr:DegT/DnrJ/EryC1/StrS family aminotransferase [Helicobacter rodentium]